MDDTVSTQPMRVANAKSPRWQTVMRWLALGIVLLLTMEFAARLDDKINHDAPLLGNYTFDQLFEFDGVVIRGTPNASYMKWSLNSIGLRGPEVDLSQQRPRVIVYGASEVFGIYETPGKDFPRQLEAELRSRSKADRVEVINAGIPGMRIGSGSIFLRKLSEQVKPQVVVLYPTPTHYVGVTRPYCGRPEREPSLVGKAVSPSSRLKEKAVDRLKETLPPTALYVARKAAIWFSARSGGGVDHINPASLLAMEADLRCAVKTVRASGAQPVLVTHTNRFGNKPDASDKYLMTGWRMQYPTFTELALLEIDQRANQVIKDVAQTENIPLVDAEAAMSDKTDYFADHAHFNDSGSKRMSQLLADTVQPLLK